jgi:hypothetical protein
MLILVLLILGGVPHFFLLNNFIIVKDSKVSSQTVAYNYLILEKLMNFCLCLAERLSFSHVMRSHTGDPSSEISYSSLRLYIFVIQHLPIVVDN